MAQYTCQYTCSTNPLQEIYPNQNMCLLLDSIPPALQGLSYVMYPCSDVYNTNRFGFNKRFNFFPTSIIVPQNQSQLVTVFQVLKQLNLPFSIRSGGHCFGPGSLSNGYVIDMRNFNSIVTDIPNSQVFIGTGCRLGDIISALGAINYAIPSGDCPSVGIGGLALGGGVGFLSRMYGLTCDSIINITLLTAQGTVIVVDENNDPDLFWALCGAGAGSYGIVLGFTFNMYFIPEVSYVSLIWNWDPAQAAQIFNAWQTWIATLPESITTACVFSYNAGVSQVNISGLKVGSQPFTEWQSAFSKFNPTVAVNFQGTYLDAATQFASVYTQSFGKAKSKFLFQELPKAALQKATHFFSQLQENPCNIYVRFEFGSLGGAVSTPHPNSSFFPRNALVWFFQFAYWPFDNQSTLALNSLRQIYHDIEPYTSPYSYASLVDYELGASYLNAYYGSNVSRLIAIKNIYDPTNIFTWAQAIPLTYIPQSDLNQAIQGKYCTPATQ